MKQPSEEKITRMSLAEAIRFKGKGQTDWDRLQREQAEGVEPEADPGKERSIGRRPGS